MEQLANFSIKSLFNKRLFTNYYEKLRLVWRKYSRVNTWFVANSTNTYQYFQSVLPSRTAKNIELIHNGVDLSKFFNTQKKVISGDILKLINVGSFQEKKNQQLLVDIALELSRRGVNFEFHLLGIGEKRADVEKKVHENKLSDKFVFHGNVSDVENRLRNSDIYVHTAWYEPFGIVFLEAMASGLPIVSLDGKGNRDIIEHDFNGYIFKDQDPKVFAEKIIELATHPETYSRISENAKEFSKKFDIKIKAQEYIDFYKKILNKDDYPPKA